jgi:hypothetical protein
MAGRRFFTLMLSRFKARDLMFGLPGPPCDSAVQEWRMKRLIIFSATSSAETV